MPLLTIISCQGHSKSMAQIATLDTACNAMNKCQTQTHTCTPLLLILIAPTETLVPVGNQCIKTFSQGICIRFTEATDYTHTKRLHERPQNLSLRVPALDCMVNAAPLFSHTAHTTGHLECPIVTEDDAFKIELSQLLSLNSSFNLSSMLQQHSLTHLWRRSWAS